jgi:hypothetical protein
VRADERARDGAVVGDGLRLRPIGTALVARLADEAERLASHRPRVRVKDRQLRQWYGTLDRLLRQKPQVEQALFLRLRNLFSLTVDLVFYDLTSTYFEGNGPAGLANHGHSRDGKPRNRQVLVGVVMIDGWPNAHHVFEGNQRDAMRADRGLGEHELDRGQAVPRVVIEYGEERPVRSRGFEPGAGHRGGEGIGEPDERLFGTSQERAPLARARAARVAGDALRRVREHELVALLDSVAAVSRCLPRAADRVSDLREKHRDRRAASAGPA